MITAAVVSGLILAVVIAPTDTAPPGGDAPADSVITWSVRPADENGTDGRAWVERDVDPGDLITEYLAVSNFSDAPVTFRLSAADGYFTETGRFTMLPASEDSVAAGLWVDVQETVDVGADSVVLVPFTIAVPNTAAPGDIAAGIAASVFSVGAGADGTQIGVESRVGFRVMLRVSGELSPAFDVDIVNSTFDLSWNPFRPGSVTLTYELANEGNTRLMTSGALEASGRFGLEPVAMDERHELLPGDVRQFEHTIEAVWPIGLLRVALEAQAVTEPGNEAAGTVNREYWVWAIPWPQLLLTAGAIVIMLALLWRRRRQRESVEKLIADARRDAERTVRDELEGTQP